MKKLKINNWYELKSGEVVYPYENLDKDVLNIYGFCDKGWIVKAQVFSRQDNQTLASKNKVEKILVKEAKRRGFVKGSYIKSIYSSNHSMCYGNLYLNDEMNVLFSVIGFEHIPIFKNGEWAEVKK